MTLKIAKNGKSIECCDGFYCKAKSTTKVPGPFVVEMAFAQIKPAKINLSLFGR